MIQIMEWAGCAAYTASNDITGAAQGRRSRKHGGNDDLE
jgi:hypothetical protein